MMYDTTNPVRLIKGVVHVTSDDGDDLATFAGHDLQEWRQFQLDTVKRFNIVVPDTFMPVGISETVTTPDKRKGEYFPTGG